jgi:hypothetical protein
MMVIAVGAGDAPPIAKLGRNGVGLRPDQSAKTLCLNSKHRTREALDKSLKDGRQLGSNRPLLRWSQGHF